MIGFIKTVKIDAAAQASTTSDFAVVGSIEKIPETYWKAKQHSNLFLQKKYLTALEKVLPKGVAPLYVLLQSKGSISMCYFQVYEFKQEHFAMLDKASATSIAGKLQQRIKQTALQFLDCTNCKLLIAGNIVHTGAPYMQNNSSISDEEFFINAVAFLKQQYNIDAVILKDTPNVPTYKPLGKTKQWHSFYTQPAMELNIPAHWKSMNDYYNDLLPKYKKRVVNTNNKNTAIVSSVLDLESIVKWEATLYNLYTTVYEKSDTKINKVATNYFSTMKAMLPTQFQVVGYFIDEKLIGFASYYINAAIVEANFVGLDYAYNKTHKLYQTILYDYIQFAIQHNCSQLKLGRTGLEIKSTIGAVPQDLPCYIQFESKTLATFGKPLLKRIPEEKFEQRHPFK